MWESIGIDWDSGGWLAVGITDGEIQGAAVYDDIGVLWDERGETARRILIDVPIGLCDGVDTDRHDDFRIDDGDPDKISRICDRLARSLLGGRSSSVFPCPCRSAARLAAADMPHSDISAENRRRTGKGLSIQSANISAGIHRIDRLLTEGPADPDCLLEGHPELCFRAFADKPLQHAKLCAGGIDERLTLMEQFPEYEHGDWRRLARQLADDYDGRTGIDDLIDATALAITAAAPDEDFHSLPADPPRDAKGVPMQMLYRRRRPFDVAW